MARSTANKTNVVAPGGDYPYGRVKDNDGSNNGTPVNEELLGDYVQFFEKLAADAGITFNELPENNTNGFQFVEALKKLFVKSEPSAPLATKVIEIGDWNMDTSPDIYITHGLDKSKIRGIDVVIISDFGEIYTLERGGVSTIDAQLAGWIISVDDDGGTFGGVGIRRSDGGFFDQTAFDSTPLNRGFVTITYEQ